MKVIKGQEIITPTNIIFDDDVIISSGQIMAFIELVEEAFINTIGKDRSWTESYFTFDYDEEILMDKLLELDVIRLTPRYEQYHERILDTTNIGYHISDLRYWLSDGYHKFIEDYENANDVYESQNFEPIIIDHISLIYNPHVRSEFHKASREKLSEMMTKLKNDYLIKIILNNKEY